MSAPTIALLPWGHVIEDFIDNLGYSFERFCNEMMGSWMFGYVQAFQEAGIRPVIICISARERKFSRFVHSPTGATVRVLSPLLVYKAVRSQMQNPYSWSIEDAYGWWKPTPLPFQAMRQIMKDAIPYLSTPPLALARVLREEGCGAILCQEYEYARFDVCIGLGRVLRIPVFATFQGGDWQASRFERPLRPMTLRKCAGLIIATQTEVRRVQNEYGIPAEKLARIFNPIDLCIWKPMDREEARSAIGIPLGAEVVVWHGRIQVTRKGLDTLLQAWTHLYSDRPGRDLRLVLIGTGNDASLLQSIISELNVKWVIWINEFMSDRKVIRCYLSAADVYAFPSRHEGFPVAPIEAMACGLPVAAADAPGVPDILEGGEASGGLVVPRDDSNARASAIGSMLDNIAWRRDLGRRARLRVEARFSLDVVGAQLRDFCLRQGLRPRP